MRTLAALAIVVVALVSLAPAASAAPQTKRQLKAQVKVLKRERNEWRREAQRARRERNDALAAIGADLPTQVAAIARAGKVGALHAAVFEPIRVNWLCGSTLFQGQYLYSLDVDLTTYDNDGNEISCR